MCMQENLHIQVPPLDETEYHDIACRLVDFHRDNTSCYDQFDEQQIEGHDPRSNSNKCSLPSIFQLHTGGGKMRVVSYRSVSRSVGRNSSPVIYSGPRCFSVAFKHDYIL